MGVFRRRPAGREPDAELSLLTVAEADHLRRLVGEAFAEHGFEVTMHPDHARGPLVHFAATGYADGAGGVSPHVYWWNGTAYVRVTEYHDSGQVELVVGDELGAALDAVC